MQKIDFMQRRQWFLDQVGKKIYRKDNRCNCDRCKVECVNFVLVRDSAHATFLHEMENTDMKIIYFDNKSLKA